MRRLGQAMAAMELAAQQSSAGSGGKEGVKGGNVQQLGDAEEEKKESGVEEDEQDGDEEEESDSESEGEEAEDGFEQESSAPSRMQVLVEHRDGKPSFFTTDDLTDQGLPTYQHAARANVFFLIVNVLALPLHTHTHTCHCLRTFGFGFHVWPRLARLWLFGSLAV